ncbi:MAG: VOC family protein [Dehalococcoidia bacterium]
MLNLAKQHLDLGIFTNRLEEQLAFWQGTAGLPFDELLPVGGGVRQHRHSLNGSVFKLNHVRSDLPAVPSWTGYRRLLIARPGLAARRDLVDPDGNLVSLVPQGFARIEGIAVELAVRDEAAFHDFYSRVLQLPAAGPDAYRSGDSLVWFSQSPHAGEAGPMQDRGFRYLTVQVWDVEAEHAAILSRGGREGRPPVTLGNTARISFVRDPDGNWIEVSQRASLTGPLPPTD